MNFLYMYRYDPDYTYDGFFHADMVKHIRKAGHQCFAYGPKMEVAYSDIIILKYNPNFTMEEINRCFKFDVIICGTQARMFFKYRPPLAPPISKAIKEECWLPRDFNSCKIPKIVLDEDTHYESDNNWYKEAGINIVFDRHKKNAELFHKKGNHGIKGFWLPMSVDAELFSPNSNKRIGKISMVASVVDKIYPCRRMLLDILVPLGLMDDFTRRRMIGKQYVDCLRNYVGCANCSSIYYITSAKMFEIMASGSVLLTDNGDEYGLKELFPDNSYVTYERNGSNVIKRVSRILNDGSRVKEITTKARQCILERHTHEIRIKELVEKLEKEL